MGQKTKSKRNNSSKSKCEPKGKTLWRQAVDALRAANGENFTSEFGQRMQEEGWFQAFLDASFTARRENRVLWVDLMDVSVAPERVRLQGATFLPVIFELQAVQLISKLLISNEVVEEYDTLVQKTYRPQLRVLLFYKDMSCNVSLECILCDIAGRIARETAGVLEQECAVCLETKPMFASFLFMCTHVYCRCCSNALVETDVKSCPACRAQRTPLTPKMNLEAECAALWARALNNVA